ncbi:MAG: cytochrome C [Saprospiraceae bacterium]|nr:cytochrome C [Saprospiraceae bacterium]
MKRIIKLSAYALLGILALVLCTSFYLTKKFESQSTMVHSIKPVPVAILSDSASLERGGVLAVGCRSCHGTDLSGKYFFDDPAIGKMAAPNLTRAKGSPLENYADIDYVRALRHCLNPKGNPLMIMPSESYTHLSDKDLGALIGYLKTLEPKENQLAPPSFTYLAKVMAGAGLFGDMYPYDIINHDKAKNIPHPADPPSLEYGSYLSRIGGCVSCHKADLGGGPSPDPASPIVPDISKGGNMGKWTQAQFINVFRTGKTPEGKMLNDKFMPFTSVAAFSDVEIASLYDYIMTLPAAPKRDN